MLRPNLTSPTDICVDTRNDHRRRLRSRRRTLPHRQRHAAARQAARQFPLATLFARHQRIALYLASDGELDPAPLLQRLQDAGRQCYLPVLNRHHRRPMHFAEYQAGMPMRPNRYAIPEPAVSPAQMLPAQALDLLIMPLVGFDGSGNRLGMGGGFYDRTLAFLRHRRRLRRPQLIGLAYHFQRLDRLQERPWDVPLDGILTEKYLQRFW